MFSAIASQLRTIWTILQHSFTKAETVQYPEQQPYLAPRYRGRIVLTRDPDGEERCVACNLCAVACPVDCIDMIPEEESLGNWHWQIPDPVSRRVDIITTDAMQDDASRNQAA